MEVLPTANFQPDLVIGGLRIGEPMIAFTSVLVGLTCLYAWYRLGKIEEKDDPLKLSRIFFLLTGISTLIGGLVGHAFIYALPFAYKLPGWSLGIIALSALEQASTIKAREYLGHRLAKVFSWINIIELTMALWFLSATLWFPVVEIHSAFGFLLVVAPLEIFVWSKTRSAGSLQILWGILLLIGAVMAHILKISLGVWFCYFDIAHLFMCAAMWKIMVGAEKCAYQAQATIAGNEPHAQNVPS